MTPFVFASSRNIARVLAEAEAGGEPLEKVLVCHDISTGTGDMETVTRFCYTGPVTIVSILRYISDTTMKHH